MKNFKRMIGCLLAATMPLALAACGRQAVQPSQTPAPVQSSQTTDGSAESREPTASTLEAAEPTTGGESGKALVVYYSATGNTAAVAATIADTLEADTFEITPAEPYTSGDLNWNDENSRVAREHEDESLRTIELTAATVENWDEYDTVFIGYPIWWGIAAWPVDGFIAANDFTGKTVVPFCTSSSSDLGESGELLAGQAGTGDWLTGRRFSGSASKTDVADWVNGLGIDG